VDGRVNPGELLINVVRSSKPKALIGLNQKVCGKYSGISHPLSSLSEPPAKRQSPHHP
jgi:hypothetical protein